MLAARGRDGPRRSSRQVASAAGLTGPRGIGRGPDAEGRRALRGGAPAGPSPLVEVAASDRENCWEITVRDNGADIPPAYREKVFGLFQRLPSGKALHPGGSGVGLAIVARIVETHGGTCWIESEEGVGTTFHCTLPKRAAAETGNGTAPASGTATF